ncbi:MAG: hypothetical protein L6V35_04175 [Alistipes putredinis]|nr:MAG: hypothetical protein L6V35_04175 [Alistipes putredinis]
MGTGFLPTDTDNVCDMTGSYYSDYYYQIFGGDYVPGSDPSQIIEQSRYYYGGLRSTWAFFGRIQLFGVQVAARGCDRILSQRKSRKSSKRSLAVPYPKCTETTFRLFRP